MKYSYKINKIIEIFDDLYKDASCSLDFKNSLELLISTQLAAQCTDVRVNEVAKALYTKYKTVEDFANCDLNELEEIIKPTGFYRNKAKHIKECCILILKKFDGQVPDTMEELLLLPGVGRKTANLILGDIFGKPAVVIDTHAKRLSNRIGLTKSQDPKKIEFDLMKILPINSWTKFCHQMVFHGRAVCTSRKPKCFRCKISSLCDFGKNIKGV